MGIPLMGYSFMGIPLMGYFSSFFVCEESKFGSRGNLLSNE